MRIFSAFAFAIGCLAAVACSSTSTSGSPSSATTQSTDSSGDACNIGVGDYDQSCTQDTDCVGAPPGGDICGACHGKDPAFLCTLAAINTKDSERYKNDLANAIAGQGAPAENCATSCPVGSVPKCVDNVCKLVDPSSNNGDD